MLPLDVLNHVPMMIASGPTGRSHYWPEQFGVLHPALATTDLAFNRIDAVWMPRDAVTIRVYLDIEDTAIADPPLGDALQTLRSQVALPAADIAAMVGVKRRQLYNLLTRGRAPAERERWIHVLASAFDRIDAAADHDPARVRAAVLKPLADGRSLFARACAQDEQGLQSAVAELADELRAGGITGRVRRPSPTLRRRGGSADDFLSGYRGRDGD
jgi:hypothetical protein